MNDHVKQIESKLEEVIQSHGKNEDNIRLVDTEMERLASKVESHAKMLEKKTITTVTCNKNLGKESWER
jgi:hypothetical protein